MAPRSTALFLVSGAARFFGVTTSVLGPSSFGSASFVKPQYALLACRHDEFVPSTCMPVYTRRRPPTAIPPKPSPKRRSTRRTLVATTEKWSDDMEGLTPTTKGMKRTKVELSTPNLAESDSPVASAITTNKKNKSPKSPPLTPGSKTPPADFETIYSLVEELRQDRTAPVDHSGSEALPEKHRGDVVFRFQVLIALMLSSQTKDAVVGEAMRKLQAHGLDVDTISATPHDKLNSLIQRVGFHNNKTKYIKQAVEILHQEYNGDIPPNAVEIMKLPGVGPKMAFIVENVAWNATTGIGIDTHMHRMFNELRWVKSKNPEQTRVQLESWLPRDYWASVNILWVGFGQEVQQFKPRIIEKALACSRPAEALRLIKRLGVDLMKEGKKLDLTDQIRDAMGR